MQTNRTITALIQAALKYHNAGDFGKAGNLYNEILETDPGNIDAIYLSGVLAYQVGNNNIAIKRLGSSIRFNPGNADAYFYLGNAFLAMGDMKEALINFTKATDIRPGYAEAYNNIGNIQQSMGDIENAIENYRKALDLKPNYVEANYNLGLLHLMTGDFGNGWKGYEWRTVKPGNAFPIFDKPRWDGSSLRNKTIYVHCEQGMGDTIQFSRYIPLLRGYGAERVIFKPQAPLTSLFKHNNLKADIVDVTTPEGTFSFDTYIPLLSLPRIFRTDLTNIPSSNKYLEAERDKALLYKKKHIKDDPIKVGIFWQGQPKYNNDKTRSVPLTLFYRLADIPGVRLYSLQKGYGEEQLDALPDGPDIVDLGRTFNDFADTAAALENLDLLISIDTAVAHLSGAMGKPTWILLPAFSDWRWLLNTENSPWYESVRLFRQKKDILQKGDAKNLWSEVMEIIYMELKKLVEIQVDSL